ncbi:MAG: PhoH family protein [Clostridiales bacterium]|jgi:phosphate starvation-inducible PhoH-like protein|nr:PhoH family protein [Clostridiales bacterium]
MIEKTMVPENVQDAPFVFGSKDEFATIVEDAFCVRILPRGDEIRILGEDEALCTKAESVLLKMFQMVKSGDSITRQLTAYLVDMAAEGGIESVQTYSPDVICMTSRGRQLKAKTKGQKQYVDSIKDNTIVFGIGPAGTGKTYLAVAMAVTAFKNKEIARIILTRPAVEAGEKLGFLPGDLQNKVDPYLRPLYDALFDIMGMDSYNKNLEKGAIEIAPLAYMRGRTLDDAFIILDEAQNTTPEQMKMFLTRIGQGSRAVVTGDITQIDLPRDKSSGLKVVQNILKDIQDISFIYLTEKDVVRHELVQKIIKAYEKYDKSAELRKKRQETQGARRKGKS